jgi:hypothetical protein
MSQMLTALLRCLQKIMLIPRVAHYFINHAYDTEVKTPEFNETKQQLLSHFPSSRTSDFQPSVHHNPMSNPTSTLLQNTPSSFDLRGLQLFTPESPNRVAIPFTHSPNFDHYAGRLHQHLNEVGNTLDIALRDFFNWEPLAEQNRSSPTPLRHDDEINTNIAYIKAVVNTLKVIKFSRLCGDDSRARK